MKLFGRPKTDADENGGKVEKDQRVEVKVRGVGRTSGTVKELEDEALLITLVVPATAEAMSLEAPDAVLEFATLRGLYRQKGFVSYSHGSGETVRFVGREEPELMQRREFVRVEVNISVSVSLKEAPWPTDFDALNISANGILLAGPSTGTLILRRGMFLRMKIPLYDGRDAIDVRGTVVREAQRGAVGVRFDHINEPDQERLVRFVMKQEREQRKRGVI